MSKSTTTSINITTVDENLVRDLVKLLEEYGVDVNAPTSEKLEPQPKPKKAPKKAKKTAPAPKNQPKGPWYEDIVHAKWVKEWKTSDMASTVKVHPEAGHGPELRAAGFRPMKGNQWWWAYKDYAKAKAMGDKYLTNKAARAGKVA